MPFPLHKAPRGLLELLRLRTLGAQPNQFSEQVVPVIDVTEFYANYHLTSVTIVAAAAAFPLALQDVQTGAQKRYLGASAEVVMGAAVGTYLSIDVGIESPSQAEPFFPLFPTRQVVGAVAGEGYFHGGMLPVPLVPPPGCVFTVSASSDAAGADHVIAVRILFQNLVPGEG